MNPVVPCISDRVYWHRMLRLGDGIALVTSLMIIPHESDCCSPQPPESVSPYQI